MSIISEKQQESKVEEKRPQVPFFYTKITSSKSRLSKEFYLETDEQGQETLQKQGGGQLWEGKVEVRQVESLQKYLLEITSSDGEPWVAVYGLPKKAGDIFELVTTNNVEGELGKRQITRTKECFAFAKGEPGFLVEDYDPQKFIPDLRDANILTKEELLDILYKVMPEWKEKDIQISIVDSTSSYIYRTTNGQKLKGEGGKRIIVPVDDASQIPVISEELEKRLWLTGYGRHKITKAGSLVKTTIFDLCYGKQPERIDFTPAGAICRDGVEQRRPEPLMVGTKIMVAEDLLLTSNRKNTTIKELVQADRKNREKEAEPVRKIWLAARVEEIIRKNPNLTRESAREQAEAEYKGELGMDSTLRVEGYDEPVSVAEILADRVGFHGKKCYPPMSENDEDKQRFCAIIFSNQDKPIINSFAHGGVVFYLPKTRESAAGDPRKEWVFPFGKNNDEGAKALTEELASTNELFSRAGERSVFVITEDGITPLTSVQLEREITNRYRIVEHPGEPARELSRRNLERIWATGQTRFPKCLGISKIPVIRKDGSWMSQRGYDKESQYFVEGFWKINENPSRSEVRESLDLILNKVWGEYSFSSPRDSRGVLLSLILSGFYIPLTQTRPGYLITAAERDSGKTLLATTINLLIDNTENTKDLKTRSDNDELIRMVEADRRKGIRVHLFDNLKDGRSLWEPTLSMVLTSSSISHKKLHSNDSISTKNDILAIFTGNNIIAAQDNTRRVFCLYIEKQKNKSFSIHPDAFVRKNRDSIIQAIVILINAYRNTGYPEITDDRIGSYGVWDRVVRQNILWLGREFPEFQIGDPRENMREGEAENPDDQNARSLFYEMESIFGNEKFSASDIVRKIKDGEEDLREALEALFPSQPKAVENSHTVSQKLGALKNRTFSFAGDYQLTLQRLGAGAGNKVYFQMERTQSKSALSLSDKDEVVRTDEVVRKREWRRKEVWEVG